MIIKIAYLTTTENKGWPEYGVLEPPPQSHRSGN
jgi:hypothetical protein